MIFKNTCIFPTSECVKQQKTTATNGVVNKKIASEVTAESIFFVFILFKLK